MTPAPALCGQCCRPCRQRWTRLRIPDVLDLLETLAMCVLQACGCGYEVSDDEVEEGEVDKLVQGVLRLAAEVPAVTS